MLRLNFELSLFIFVISKKLKLLMMSEERARMFTFVERTSTRKCTQIKNR